MTIVMVAVALLASLDGRSSFGQQERIPTNRKPACTIFCSDATMDYIVLGEHPKCFGGPLPARTAGDQFKDVSEEDRKAACEKLKTSDKTAESCPALKILLAACKEKEAPPPEKEPLKCKERSSDVPWFDPSAEGCQQLQDTRMNANWTAMNGGTCTLTLTACNYTALTYAVNLVSEKNGKLETVIFADRPTPATLPRWVSGRFDVRNALRNCTTLWSAITPTQFVATSGAKVSTPAAVAILNGMPTAMDFRTTGTTT
jgi:hypothetical protein